MLPALLFVISPEEEAFPPSRASSPLTDLKSCDFTFSLFHFTRVMFTYFPPPIATIEMR